MYIYFLLSLRSVTSVNIKYWIWKIRFINNLHKQEIIMDTNVHLDTEKGDVEINKLLLVIPSRLKKSTSY